MFPLVPLATGLVVLAPGSVVIVNEFMKGLRIGRALSLVGGSADGAEGDVDTGDNFALLVVVQFGAKDDLVGGDGGLDGVALEVSRQNNSADRGPRKEVAHFVGGGFPIGDSGESKVVSRPLFAVAEVLGLDNIDHLALSSELGLRSQLRIALEGVLGQRSDVIENFTFSVNGVFHSLEDCIVLFIL